MNMPRFTADASLYTSGRTYQGAVSPVRSGAIIQPAAYFRPGYQIWDYVYNLCFAECAPDLDVSCLHKCIYGRFGDPWR
jgi:hypothetical protein